MSGPDRRPDGNRVDLTTTLYGQLRGIAAARMAGQDCPQTLQATALVHEAWLRLGGDQQPKWNDRTHFLAAVAETMRHILVDRARRRKRIRHGGGLRRVDLNALDWEGLGASRVETHDDALLVVHEALDELARSEPSTAQLVKLHFFAGLTVREASEAVGLSERTAQRRLAYARAWLGRAIRSGVSGSSEP